MGEDTVLTAAAATSSARAPAASGPARAARQRDPYPGLRPFRSDESDIFFGRETQTDEMVERLKTSRFLAVVGTSGSGKSSLVRAGLIAALETGLMGAPEGARWRFAVMRPGARPMHRLAAKLFAQLGSAVDSGEAGALGNVDRGLLGARLRRGPLGIVEALTAYPLPAETNLLIVVDQFEEIFRFRREGDINEADAFVALLLATAQQTQFPVYVVLTMRSDFIGDCALFEGLPEAINESQYLTPRLSREQRRLAIVGPARACGGDVDDVLVNRLLNETGGGPDQLPVLQHLLMRMWISKARRLPPGERIELTEDDYDRVGGLRDALNRHADEIYNGLAKDREPEIAEVMFKTAEVMFRRLSESPGNIRRPTEAGEVARLADASIEEVGQVADAFRAPGANFVMPEPTEPIDDRTKLDISHESLIQRWQRLRQWSSDEAHDAESYRDLERRAQRHKRNEGGLLTSLDLQRALAWQQQRRPTRDWAERYGGDFDLAMAFLDDSEKQADRERDARKRARRRQLWFWRIAACGLLLLLVLTALSSVIAIVAQRRATEAEAEAIARYARATLEIGDSRAVILAALEALPEERTFAAIVADFMRWPLDSTDQELRAAVEEMVRSPLSFWLSGKFWAATWQALRSPIDERFYRAALQLIPGQPKVEGAVNALEQGVARPFGPILDSGDAAPIVALAVSDVAKMLISASAKGNVQRWQWTNKAGWEPLDLPLDDKKHHPLDAAFSRDGRFFATVTDRDRATIWNASSGQAVLSWTANRHGSEPKKQSNGGAIALATDPDQPNRRLILNASYNADATVWAWDEGIPDDKPVMLHVLEDPALRSQRIGQRTHERGVTTVAFSADARRVVTGSWDGTAKVWDTATGRLLYILDNGPPIRSARFSPQNSNRVVTAGQDGSVRLWCTRAEAVEEAKKAEASAGRGVRAEDMPPTPCEPTGNGEPLTGETTVPETRANFAHHRPRPRPAPVRFEAKAWDTLGRHERGAISAVFDPSGRRIASAGLDGTVRLWDATSGALLDVLRGPSKVSGIYAAVAFYGENQLAASFSDDRVFLWTLAPTPVRPEMLPRVADLRAATIDAANRRLATVASLADGGDGPASRVQIWNLGSGGGKVTPVRELRIKRKRKPPGEGEQSKGGEHLRIAFSPDGQRLLTISEAATSLWDANVWEAAGDDAPIATLDHSQPVLSFAFDAEATRIITGSADGTARIWDARSGGSLGPPLVHGAPVMSVGFDRSARWAVSAAGQTARIWETRSGKQKKTLPHEAPVVAAAFDPTGDQVATVAGDGFVRLWKIDSDNVVVSAEGLPSPAEQPFEQAPVGSSISLAVRGGAVDIVRAPAAGAPQAWTWNVAANTLENAWRISDRHRLRIAPDGGIQVRGRGEEDVPLALLPPVRKPLAGIAVSPSGGYITAFYADGQMRGLRLPASDPKEFVRYARDTVVPLLNSFSWKSGAVAGAELSRD